MPERSADLDRRRAAAGITDDHDRAISRSLSSKKRKQTGADFEAELDFTHVQYEFRRWGKIRRNYIPTRVVGRDDRGRGKRVPTGSAHVDRSGWVSVRMLRNGQCLWTGIPWEAGLSQKDDGIRRVIPVAFDAKVLKADHATYHHDVALQHQLHDLKAAADAGECAFLLVSAPAVARVFAIPIRNHFAELLSGAGVTLWEKRRWLDAPGGYIVDTNLPSITKTDDSLGWDWIPLLRYCEPHPADR